MINRCFSASASGHQRVSLDGTLAMEGRVSFGVVSGGPLYLGGTPVVAPIPQGRVDTSIASDVN